MVPPGGVCSGSAWTCRATSGKLILHHSSSAACTQWLVQQRRRCMTVAATASVHRGSDDPSKRVRRTSAASRQARKQESDMDVDEMFMDPKEAARLRKMVKNKGLGAVVDAQGIVKVPLSGTDADDLQEKEHSVAGSAAAEDEGVLSFQQPGQQRGSPSSSSSSSSPRQKLFSASQLQPAVPGSGGTAAVLPIVRPSSSSSSSSISQRSDSSSSQRSDRFATGRERAAGFYSSKSWEDLGAMPEVIEALKALGITKPSHVQAEAFRALRPKSSNRHVALADQAGSGKTLAYLLPLLQQLKQREAKQGTPATQPHSPSIIIMTPTAELAQQVGRVVRALSGAGLRVRSAVMTGGQGERETRGKTFRTQCELLAGGVDVLVATPGRLTAHLDKGSLTLQNTAALVMDEVDVLAGGEVSYSEHIAPLRAASRPDLRCVLVSATLPQHTFDELQELFMGLGAAFGPGLHRTATGCIEELVDCSGGDEITLESGTKRKLEAMMEALDRVRSPRTMIFCNKIETCRVVENALKRRNAAEACQVLAYHEAIKEEVRAASLTTWLSPPKPSQPPKVLVCTDRTSRGIDSMWCEHVVLFEFPRDPSEYVRRVGRTARGAGGKGVVTVLVLGKQVALAKDILARNKTGAPVHRVPRLWSDSQV